MIIFAFVEGVKLYYGVTAAADRQGKDRATIADMLNVRLDTVSAWFNRWHEKKLESLVDLPKSGRPSILTTVEKKV